MAPRCRDCCRDCINVETAASIFTAQNSAVSDRTRLSRVTQRVVDSVSFTRRQVRHRKRGAVRARAAVLNDEHNVRVSRATRARLRRLRHQLPRAA